MTPAQYNEYQRQADVIEEAKRWEEERKSKESDEHIVDTNEMISSQQEISDEEIEKAARDYDNAVIYGPPLLHFEQGAFWYREQLNSRK